MIFCSRLSAKMVSRFLTICGSKVEDRSRGVSISSVPSLVFRRLGVRVCSALALRFQNYEHTLTLDNSVMDWPVDSDGFTAHLRRFHGAGDLTFPPVRLEMFRYIHEHKPSKIDSVINNLAQNRATFSTSIHLMAEKFGLT